MSVKVSGLVWDHFPPDRDELVLALALADEANHDGEDIFPGLPRLAKRTRLSIRTVRRQLRALERVQWLDCVEASTGGRNKPSRYRINPTWMKDPASFKWEESNSAGNEDTVSGFDGVKPGHGVPVSAPETRPTEAPNPDTIMTGAFTQKHPDTTPLFPSFADDGTEPREDRRLAEWMFDRIKTLHPQHKPPPWRRWCRDIRLLRERDRRSRREIAELFAWANADAFWQANILSPAKLREKWDQLTLKRRSSVPPSGSPGAAIDRSCARVFADGRRCGKPGVFGKPGSGYRCRSCEQELEASST